MDGLCLKTGIHGIGSTISPVGGSLDVRTTASQVSAVGRSSVESPTAQPSRFSFRYPLRSLWAKGGTAGVKEKRFNGMALDDAVLVKEGEGKRSAVEEGDGEGFSSPEGGKESWVLKILHVRSLWKEEQQRKNDEEGDEQTTSDHVNGDVVEEEEEIDVCSVADSDDSDAEELRFDRDSFSKMLRRVSLAEAKLYAQMSYLGNLAYSIPKIKPGNLLKLRGLRFVTSSIEKKESIAQEDKNMVPTETHKTETETEPPKGKVEASTAYQIAASAASYLHSCTKSILPLRSPKTDCCSDSETCLDRTKSINMMNSDMASLMATTDSVTAVVAAKEEVKQAVADDLNSTHSSPCEWFICDDDQTSTRFFVIQGSESLASWKANLLFEPIQFEGLDVSVHRGIYEAAKGIYEQMLPEVRAHLKSCGKRATFRFTGHSLGGSLSLLVNLMLLIRGEVPAFALLPVITFGSPAIMCGGDKLLRKLGLPRSHLQAITMHRDVVPRAFSCNYPNHVAELLKAVNRNFRNHSCLNNEKLLYAPMGELLILQPEEKHSPQHELLPSGSGLYFMSSPNDGEKHLQAAKKSFLNSPHPLEILSDRSSYGSEGSIQRDHDMNSYLKSVRGVIRQELIRVRKAKREHRRTVWWSVLAPPRGVNAGVIVGTHISSSVNVAPPILEKVNFSGVLRSGRESLKRFSRLVASQHMHLFVVLLLPARLLLLGAYSVISLR